VIRLRRRGVKAPPDWQHTVDASFPDAAAFWRKARAFEKLAEHGAKRATGFAAYAPHVLVPDAKGDPEFPPAWRTELGVRRSIAGMSDGFCAYCQSSVSSNHAGKRGKDKPPGQIEHFKPKSRFPAQAYDLKNYFLACAACNGTKLDKWARGGYVRPDEGNPGGRFVFTESGGISAGSGDDQAKNTVEDFGLDDYWLVRHREIAIRTHLDAVRRYMGLPGARLEDFLIRRPAAFSEAINQSVRRAWRQRRLKAP
jgi:uncharacterized protein (TIGR02646 family)